VLLNRLAGNAGGGFLRRALQICFRFSIRALALAAALFARPLARSGAREARLGRIVLERRALSHAGRFAAGRGMVALAHPLIVTFYKSQYLPSVPIMRSLPGALFRRSLIIRSARY